MSLAPIIRALGRGPSKSRHLTQDEAREALTLVINNQAPPEAIGALFMLLRYRGENAEELAGFVEAMRSDCPKWQNIGADLDWPSYAAGRTRGLPWFLMSAKILSQNGIKIFLHGWNSHQSSLANPRAMLEFLEIPMAFSIKEARAAIEQSNIVYVGLETISPRILELLQMRDILGLRSPVNSALRVFNPSLAPCSIQGVFHPNFQELQRQTAQRLGQMNLGVIKGGGGEFEVNPLKPVELKGLHNGNAFDVTIERTESDNLRISDLSETPEQFHQIWLGHEQNDMIQSIVIATMMGALRALGYQSIDTDHVADYWNNRHAKPTP